LREHKIFRIDIGNTKFGISFAENRFDFFTNFSEFSSEFVKLINVPCPSEYQEREEILNSITPSKIFTSPEKSNDYLLLMVNGIYSDFNYMVITDESNNQPMLELLEGNNIEYFCHCDSFSDDYVAWILKDSESLQIMLSLSGITKSFDTSIGDKNE
jgi:hypothetical protein